MELVNKDPYNGYGFCLTVKHQGLIWKVRRAKNRSQWIVTDVRNAVTRMQVIAISNTLTYPVHLIDEHLRTFAENEYSVFKKEQRTKDLEAALKENSSSLKKYAEQRVKLEAELTELGATLPGGTSITVEVN